jgi:hypothetical protein
MEGEAGSMLCYPIAGRRFFEAALGVALVLGFVLTSSIPAWASGGVVGSIHGTVVDKDTGSPLADANVSVASPAGEYKTTTNAHGFFSIIGLPSDTYTVTVSKSGYQPTQYTGQTVLGDQSLDMGIIKITSAKVLGRVLVPGRATSAYQPKQTQDVTTISGARISQALGNVQSTNENNLILSAPGAVNDSSGNVSIRGSLAVELGNQFDGVPFDAAFFDENGSNGFLNNIGFGTGGSLQLVSGAGDATQGNVGAGIINIVPGRGTYPAKGEIDAEVRSPYYSHSFNFNWGFATPDNRFSNYIAISTNRLVPEYAPFGVDSSAIGQFTGISYQTHDDLIDNFFYRFGRGQDQQFQALVRFANLDQFGNYGGIGLAHWYSSDPGFLCSNAGYLGGSGTAPQTICPGVTDPVFGAPVQDDQVQALKNLLTYFPGVPVGNATVTQPEEIAYQPLHFIKLGYSRTFNPTTYLNTYYYNWGLVQGGTNYTSGGSTYFQIGGSRDGNITELTHIFSDKHQVTLATKVEAGKPLWDQQAADTMFFNLGLLSKFLYAGGLSGQGVPVTDDWYLPVNPSLISTGGGGTNPCLGVGGAPDAGGCYIHDQMMKMGLWNGQLPTIPTMGIGYHGSTFMQYGVGLRDQWSVNQRLKLDYGLRVDYANYKFGPNFFALDPYGNPSDVNPYNQIGYDFLKPHFFEPRFAAAYQMGDNDSLRASYGRSVQFFFAQTAGTPAAYNSKFWNPVLFQLPPKDNTGLGPQCGSGWHGPGSGYTQNPNNYYAVGGAGGWFFPCSNYAQELFWTWDQMDDAPDLGGQGPPTYNDYDLEWSHQFTHGRIAGWGMKLAAFARRGYNVEQNILLLNGPPNPVTGQSSASVFATRANGVEKVTGLEGMITTPDVAYGLSGFISLNYVNELTNTPPVATGLNQNSDNLPILPQQLLQTGLLFHAGFLPPFSGRAGATYTFRNHLKISPSVGFNGGYPIDEGRTSIGYVNGVLFTLPTTNFGQGVPFSGPNGPGNPYNSCCYVDPAYPGDYFNPNIAATRGNSEPALAGQALSRPQAFLDVDLQYPIRQGLTLGATVFNVFNNHYGIPFYNTAWQAVATGVGGPQTGEFAGAYPGTPFYNTGSRNEFGPAGANLPIETGFNAGTIYNFYIQSKF